MKVSGEGRVQALRFPVQQIVELCHQLDELLGMFFLLDALAKSDYPLSSTPVDIRELIQSLLSLSLGFCPGNSWHK